MLLPAAWLPRKRDWGAGQGGIAGTGIWLCGWAGFSLFLQIPGCKLNKPLFFLKESLGSWPRARQTRRTSVTCLQSTTPCSQCPLSSTCSASSCPAHRDRTLGHSGPAAAHTLLSFSCSPSPASGLHWQQHVFRLFCYASSHQESQLKTFNSGMSCSSKPLRGEGTRAAQEGQLCSLWNHCPSALKDHNVLAGASTSHKFPCSWGVWAEGCHGAELSSHHWGHSPDAPVLQEGKFGGRNHAMSSTKRQLCQSKCKKLLSPAGNLFPSRSKQHPQAGMTQQRIFPGAGKFSCPFTQRRVAGGLDLPALRRAGK